MTTIKQEFQDALALHSADEILFQPLLEKFNELKQVLESNFRVTHSYRSWYGKKVTIDNPYNSIELNDKITHSSRRYLVISIYGYTYVMGLGEYGELKDRVYFCPGIRFGDNGYKTKVYSQTSSLFGITDYCLEDKITCVQLFSKLIKNYKMYLVNK